MLMKDGCHENSVCVNKQAAMVIDVTGSNICKTNAAMCCAAAMTCSFRRWITEAGDRVASCTTEPRRALNGRLALEGFAVIDAERDHFLRKVAAHHLLAIAGPSDIPRCSAQRLFRCNVRIPSTKHLLSTTPV